MKPSKFLSSPFVSIAVSCILLGCQLPEQHAGVAPFGSMAQITAIAPDTVEVLRVGEHVKLKVDVSYVLTAESGTVQLIVLAADNSDLAQDFKVLTKGRGKSTLQAEFTVPVTTAIQVFTPLVVQGQHPTSATDGRAFKVLPR